MTDETISIKAADRGSVTVVWDKTDYLHKESGQLQDNNT